MRRFVTVAIVTVLLICGAVSAQTIPEWMVGDFVGTAGPIDIQLKLVDFNSPWSTPDPTMNHVLFGEISFIGESVGAVIDVSSIALMRCGQPIGCYAYNSRPLYIHERMKWVTGYGTYIWVNGLGNPAFSALTVDLDSMSAYWSSGTFYEAGGEWVIHESAFYSLYLVEPLTMPIFPYAPAPMVLE